MNSDFSHEKVLALHTEFLLRIILKMKIFWFFAILAIFIRENGKASGAKILVVAFVSTKSHKLTYMPLVEELGKRGHNLTVLTPIPATKAMKNVQEILTLDETSQKETFQVDLIKKKEENKQESPFARTEWFVQACRDTYDLPVVQQIMKEKFDLIITQPLLNECATGLFYKVGAPLVMFSPVSAPTFMATNMGVYFPPSYVPHMFLPLIPEMNFYERMLNLGTELYIGYQYASIFLPAMQKVVKEKVGEDIPSILEVFGNTSLLLSNGHFAIHYHKPFLPDIIEVGGLNRKSKIAKPLGKDLEEFIKKGKDGFILFSMGTLIKSENMSEEKRKLFLNVFSKLKQQIIWKWDTETMEGLPENVKLSKWLPQEDVLGHKDIKLFITHCGGGGTEEAIYHGVPMVGLPIYADQPLNAKVAKSHGVLIELDWNVLTEDLLLSSIQEILNNPKYRDNVKKLSTVYRDQPQDQMEKAVYWVEYVIRHKGAPHLRSASRKLNWIQYHSFDVIGAYLLIIFVLLYVLYALIRLVFKLIVRICCSTSSSRTKQKNE